MSAASPTELKREGGSGYGSAASDHGQSPLSQTLGFLKNLTEKKNVRVDGTQPKRRGPKPDSKPALTRRQELNRQAQRTHRERKELYIKALEAEVLRLKENFSDKSRSSASLAEENRQLKALLAQHGIPWTGTGGVEELSNKSSQGYTSPSMSGAYSPPSQTHTSSNNTNYASASPTTDVEMGGQVHGRSMAKQQNQRGVDGDQAGIDFVLTLERPCMDHMQFLVERASEPDGEPCGHALMASCPPDPFVSPDIPFNTHNHVNGHNLGAPEGKEQRTWDLSKPDLANLLDLSKRLNLDGEITPVMAWGMILAHDRFTELHTDDFEKLCLDLGSKVRCYGFGAVLEEFEVRDALDRVLYMKPEMF